MSEYRIGVGLAALPQAYSGRSRRTKIYYPFSFNNIATFYDYLFDTLCYR